MRIWIAAFLLLLLACQTPLAIWGKPALKIQVLNNAEEEDDTGDDENNNHRAHDAVKVKKQSPLVEEDYLHHNQEASIFYSIRASELLQLHRSDHLPVIYAGEVATPPPNYC